MSDNRTGGALAGKRCRVVVSTDIGGSDPDDFQSMVHYLLYADVFDTEGLISSPWGAGRASDIHTVIDCYEQDYPNLRTWSCRYPAPCALRKLVKQGALDFAPWRGWDKPTEGSDWLVQCARRDDPRSLYVLAWGLLEDIAQALHDAPDILPKLRVHYIGGPNKKWGQNAYAYVRANFPDLWMIENNSTYRGWFCGGNMAHPWGNDAFVQTFAAGHGALGEYFASHLGGVIKMGDTPTVAWLLSGAPETPETESWGGSFERVRDMPACRLSHPVATDTPTEVFGVTEIAFGASRRAATVDPVFWVDIGGQSFAGYQTEAGEFAFRFVAKETGDFQYRTRSAFPEMDGLTGVIRALPENPETRRNPRGNLTNWWSDRQDAALAEGAHKGAKTVNRWREAYLRDFAARLARCQASKRRE